MRRTHFNKSACQWRWCDRIVIDVFDVNLIPNYNQFAHSMQTSAIITLHGIVGTRTAKSTLHMPTQFHCHRHYSGYNYVYSFCLREKIVNVTARIQRNFESDRICLPYHSSLLSAVDVFAVAVKDRGCIISLTEIHR